MQGYFLWQTILLKPLTRASNTQFQKSVCKDEWDTKVPIKNALYVPKGTSETEVMLNSKKSSL